mmetsp:Transcript_34101/g.97532  ORF Transcript_34101/g.97532 Transcript_34101/m.97532 type:complete len:211 (+) Transcript_34101:2300-2932(+)
MILAYSAQSKKYLSKSSTPLSSRLELEQLPGKVNSEASKSVHCVNRPHCSLPMSKRNLISFSAARNVEHCVGHPNSGVPKKPTRPEPVVRKVASHSQVLGQSALSWYMLWSEHISKGSAEQFWRSLMPVIRRSSVNAAATLRFSARSSHGSDAAASATLHDDIWMIRLKLSSLATASVRDGALGSNTALGAASAPAWTNISSVMSVSVQW